MPPSLFPAPCVSPPSAAYYRWRAENYVHTPDLLSSHPRCLGRAQPFQSIAMDVAGPLPQSSSGNQYILVMCDYPTRFPEAVLMKEVDAVSVAEKLVKIFSRVGIPQEILTYHGTTFISQLLVEPSFQLQSLIKPLNQSVGLRIVGGCTDQEGVLDPFPSPSRLHHHWLTWKKSG